MASFFWEEMEKKEMYTGDTKLATDIENLCNVWYKFSNEVLDLLDLIRHLNMRWKTFNDSINGSSDKIKTMAAEMNKAFAEVQAKRQVIEGIVGPQKRRRKEVIDVDDDNQPIQLSSVDPSAKELSGGGGFVERFGAKPGKAPQALPGQFITPKTLLRYMQLGWEYRVGGRPPETFTSKTPGYIPYIVHDSNQLVETGGWKLAHVKFAAENKRTYEGETPTFKGCNKKFSWEDVAYLTEASEKRKEARLKEIEKIISEQKKMMLRFSNFYFFGFYFRDSCLFNLEEIVKLLPLLIFQESKDGFFRQT